MENNNRRNFIKRLSVAGAAMATGTMAGCSSTGSTIQESEMESTLIIPKAQGLKITGTFLDEISHDIPHQNWGEKEWDQDFAHMKEIGIDTVIMIRSGYKKFI